MKYFIDHIKQEEIDDVMKFFDQKVLKGCDGKNPPRKWIFHLLKSKRGISKGLYVNGKLKCILIAERMSFKGCFLWYIAAKPKDHGKGYGTSLLKHFEKYSKNIGIGWIFLNATKNSTKFYKKHKYVTSKSSNVYEHVKDL